MEGNVDFYAKGVNPTVKRFLTVKLLFSFDKEIKTICVLHLFQNLIPILLVTCSFNAVHITVNVPTQSLFLVVLLMSDYMALVSTDVHNFCKFDVNVRMIHVYDVCFSFFSALLFPRS